MSISEESIDEIEEDGVIDRLFDGSPYPTTKEGLAELLARMDSREPLEQSDEERALFEAELQRTREEQKELVRLSWEKETDQLK